MKYSIVRYIRNKDIKHRCLQLLKPLRQGLDRIIPKRKLNETLVFGTWNIREFDGNAKGFGPRKDDAFVYIAEVISRFDVIAIQELNDSLVPLERVMSLLGDDFKYIVTDVSAWKNGGNNERLGFIYDTRTVTFKGISGELVLPQNLLIRDNEGKPERQFARSPFMCSFQAGWFKFMVSTVHIYFGEESEKSHKFKRREDEIEKVAIGIGKKAKKSMARTKSQKDKWYNPYNFFIVGDFNIVDENNVTYDALTKNGFTTVKNKKGSNIPGTKFYDQISYFNASNVKFIVSESEEEQADGSNPDQVFRLFRYIYTAEQFPLFRKDIEKYVAKNHKVFNKKIDSLDKKISIKLVERDAATTPLAKDKIQSKIEDYKQKIKFNKNLMALKKKELEEFYMKSPWRTFQLSDHLPLFVEIGINYSDEYLDYVESAV